jgi:hypothetical protein
VDCQHQLAIVKQVLSVLNLPMSVNQQRIYPKTDTVSVPVQPVIIVQQKLLFSAQLIHIHVLLELIFLMKECNKHLNVFFVLLVHTVKLQVLQHLLVYASEVLSASQEVIQVLH